MSTQFGTPRRYTARSQRHRRRRAVLRLLAAGGVGAVSVAAAAHFGVLPHIAAQTVDKAAAAAATPTRTAETANMTSTSDQVTSTEKAAPMAPTATPVPENRPGEVAKAFLDAWQAQEYPAMYALLSKEAQAGISEKAFVARYQAIWNEVGITHLTAQLLPGQAMDSPVQQFHTQMEAVLTGSVAEDNSMSLILEGGRWRVQWLPSLIFKELSGDNLIHMFALSVPRGEILDRHGVKLATEVNYVSIGMVAGNMKNVPQTLAALSKVLNYPLASLEQLYNVAAQHPTWWEPIQIVPPERVAAVQQALKGYKGILYRTVSRRGYPQQDLAAQTIGYLGEITGPELAKMWTQGYRTGDWVGRSGIESWGESILAGKRGGKLAVISPSGDVVTIIAERAPQPASNIVLTIDSHLQRVAQDALDVGKLNGSVAVMRVSDGSLLALASTPSFDPNQFILGLTQQQANALFQNPNEPLLNRPVSGAYPPGSTFKTVTMPIGLASGLFTPQSMFWCTGTWDVLGFPMHCWKITGHGHISLYEGLAQSCDIVFYNVGHDMDDTKGHDFFPSMAKGFGVGQPTGIVGLVEASGQLPSPAWKERVLHEPWYPGDPVNMAIGQGYLLVTPLQMVTWLSAIANGGTLWTPRIIDKVVGPDGKVSMPAPVKAQRQLPVSPNLLAEVRAAMRETVAETKGWLGTGSWAFRDFPIPVAAKTGTAQSGQKVPHAWFASFAPYDKPEIAVVAMAEHAGEGADVAAPITRKVYEAYFHVTWKPSWHACTIHEYLCPTGWPRVPSTISRDTFNPT